MTAKREHQLLRRALAVPFLSAALLTPQVGSAQSPAEADTAPATTAVEEDYIPKAYRPSRYDSMINNNPFEREIVKPVKAQEPDPRPPFNLKLIGILRSGDAYRITLVDAKGKYQVVTQDEADNGEGFYYTDVEPAPMIQNAVVHIAQGTGSGMRKEKVSFDDKRFSVPAGRPPARTLKNNKDRRATTPTNTRSSTQRNLPKDSKTRAHDAKTGGDAVKALNASKDAAVERARAARAEQRRVVLPPPPAPKK